MGVYKQGQVIPWNNDIHEYLVYGFPNENPGRGLPPFILTKDMYIPDFNLNYMQITSGGEASTGYMQYFLTNTGFYFHNTWVPGGSPVNPRIYVYYK